MQTAAGTKVTGELGEMMRGYLFYNVQVYWHLTVFPNCQRRANHLLTCICTYPTLQSVRSGLSACKSDTQLYTDTLQSITVFMNILFWTAVYGRVHTIITISNTVHGMLKKAPQLFHGAVFNILKHSCTFLTFICSMKCFLFHVQVIMTEILFIFWLVV